MYNSNIPENRELPSTGKLIKSTLIAMVAAAALLVTTVLPAEYGIDPTGVGKMLGLTKMGEIKMSLAAEAAAEQQAVTQASAPAAPAPTPEKVEKDSMTITLTPNQGAEVKANMLKGETLTYKWESSGGKTNFDVHADSKKLKINYHNYEKGSVKMKEGKITAAFDGSHGWFWRNRTSEPLTVTLTVNGKYTDLQRVK